MEVSERERSAVRESRIPKLRQSDSPSSTSEGSLETARRLRRTANQYLKSNQPLRSPDTPRDGGGGDPGYQTMDSLDSQPKTFIVSAGTTNTECEQLEARRDNGGDNTATQLQPTTINIHHQPSDPSTLTVTEPPPLPLTDTLMVRSVSMNEEYITLNIDNNNGPSASTEELRQSPPNNDENARNLDPIYEYCSTAGATELRKLNVVVAVWELSPVKFILTRSQS